MTPETIAATVRQHNPFIQGRRNELRRLRDKLDASSVSNPAEVAATDAELAKWENELLSTRRRCTARYVDQMTSTTMASVSAV